MKTFTALFLILVFCGSMPVKAQDTQMIQSQLKGWLEEKGPWILSNETPAQFDAHLDAIKNSFTESGFKNYQKGMIKAGADEFPSFYDRACVGSVRPDEKTDDRWIAETQFYVPQKNARPQNDDNFFYQIDEADFLTVPYKAPTILDLKIFKPEKVRIRGYTIVVQKNPNGNGDFLIDQILPSNVTGMPSCETPMPAAEKLEKYKKVKGFLERDLKIINDKIHDMEGTP